MIEKHPLWLVGFRPFFILACLSGLSLPLIWSLMFSGTLPMPPTTFSSIQWHAHEMFFGFGWAVLGGFLLTATKNWVQVRGYHGAALVALVAAWVFERVGMAFGGGWPDGLFWLSNLGFIGAIVAMLLVTLLRPTSDIEFSEMLSMNLCWLLQQPAKLLILEQSHFF